MLRAIASLVTMILLCSTPRAQAPGQGDLLARARRLHRQAIVIDTHADTPMRVVDEAFDITRRASDGHIDLPRMKDGGLGAQFFAAYVSASYAPSRATHRALEMIDAIRHDIVGRAPNALALATTAADIERAHRDGRIAVLIGVEGGHAIEDSLRVLRQFHALGVRYLTLTHVNTNGWADSCADASTHNGLSPFGREVIGEMNRLGMMVDVSHASDKAMLDVLDTTRAPIIASHSSVAALSRAPRNLKDDLIRKLAANGGVMMINFSCGFVSQRYADADAARTREHGDAIKRIREVEFKGDDGGATRAIAGRWPIARPTVADVADHFDYVKRLVGNVDHLGIGSDFDGISCAPASLEDVSKLPNLTAELLRRGYTDQDLTKILGGNLLRVMRAVEAASATSPARKPPTGA